MGDDGGDSVRSSLPPRPHTKYTTTATTTTTSPPPRSSPPSPSSQSSPPSQAFASSLRASGKPSSQASSPASGHPYHMPSSKAEPWTGFWNTRRRLLLLVSVGMNLRVMAFVWRAAGGVGKQHMQQNGRIAQPCRGTAAWPVRSRSSRSSSSSRSSVGTSSSSSTSDISACGDEEVTGDEEQEEGGEETTRSPGGGIK